jgi:hypothetical protein
MGTSVLWQLGTEGFGNLLVEIMVALLGSVLHFDAPWQ